MTLILSGTDGLSDVDGSAATPAIRGTDANTGIFFPAADTIAFTEGGVEAMRIDASGNVGIGTTAPLSTTTSRVYLAIKGTGTTAGDGNGILQFQTNSAGSTLPNLGNIEWNLPDNTSSSSTRVSFITSSAEGATTNNRGSYLAFATKSDGVSGSGTERMRIDSSGNVGIGTSSPNEKLHVAGAGRFTSTATSLDQDGAFIDYSSGVARITGEASTGGTLAFYTNPNAGFVAERARIDSSGAFLLTGGNTSTSVASSVGFRALQTGFCGATMSASTNATDTLNVYSTGAGNYRFYIGLGGTVFATNTTISAISDQRLKENVQDLDVGLDAVMALKPRKFDWKEGKGKDIKGDRGWIAQEFEQVFPDMIDEWKDESPEGEEPYKSVRADLIPVLVKAIQEQQAIITQLQADVAALKGTP